VHRAAAGPGLDRQGDVGGEAGVFLFGRISDNATVSMGLTALWFGLVFFDRGDLRAAEAAFSYVLRATFVRPPSTPR
jgi:hypothetical protein